MTPSPVASTVGALVPLLVLLAAGCGGDPGAVAAGDPAVLVEDAPAEAPAAGSAPARFTPQARLGFSAGDDWEPALAADRAGRLFALYKHYDVQGGPTCPGCDMHLLFQRSLDEGRTWSAPRPIAPGPVDGGQFDPQIAVDPEDGHTLWASFLQGDNSVIAVVRSTDFGVSWTAPRIVSTQPPGLDKDTLVVRGRTIAVAYDDNLNTFAAVSHDGGERWTSGLILPGDSTFNVPLSSGGGIDSQGNLFFTWGSFDAAHSVHGDGPVTLWVTRSGDGGAHWRRTVIDRSAAPFACADCGFAFLSAQMTMRIGGDDTLYLLWNGTTGSTDFAPERIFFTRSVDHGATYAPRRQVSDAPPGVEHAFPALAVGHRRGDVRLGWMDTRTGEWNLFCRSSRDAGTTLGPAARVSGLVAGYPYLSAAGFQSPYGDYFQMTVTEDDRTQMAFGEGPSYQGPGNIWFARQE